MFLTDNFGPLIKIICFSNNNIVIIETTLISFNALFVKVMSKPFICLCCAI